MTAADREKWDSRYAQGAYAERRHPTAWLAAHVPARDAAVISPRGRALDVASGAGRNSLYLAEQGYSVDAVDISPVALERLSRHAAERGLAVRTIEADLEPHPGQPPHAGALPNGPYDLIVLVRYVQRALLPHLLERLAPGGLLIVEQHVHAPDAPEAIAGPRSPSFRYAPNELLRAALVASETGDTVTRYHEGIVTEPDGALAALAQLVLRRVLR